MFGLEILDVILGLVFIYLLLSLIVSAINEYLASMLNKRGKVLMDGLHRLLADTGLKDDFFRHPLIRTYFRDREKLLEHEERIGRKWPVARTLYRLFTWAFRPSVREARYPSYLPARTFAMAMLEVAQQAATEAAAPGAGGGAAAGSVSGANPGGAGAAGGAGTPAPAAPTIDFQKILAALRRDAGADVTEFARLELATALAGSTLAAGVKERLIDWTLGARNEAQQLHDSLEVWFNNAMDRVSGAYKRHTQYVLFWIGALLAVALNADTIDLWRRLSTDDALREGIAAQAVATWKSLAAASAAALTGDSAAADTAASDTAAADTTAADTTAGDTADAGQDSAAAAGAGAAPVNPLARGLAPRRTPNQDSAKILLDSALAQLDRTQLDLGWRAEEVTALGLVRIDTLEADGDSAAARTAAAAQPARTAWRLQWPWRWRWNTWAFWSKLLGLTLTALALSLGAPFWFDLLKKIVNVRAAGRAPHERAVSPEAGGKRPADVAPK